jgi:mannose-1-phosphate guanylyltransferase/mannose-1-phosphate guanylyltransferase/mannose-6-phosphate isomerase
VPSPQIVPVILSGGAGKRLFPLSRMLYPKQLLPLGGARTMIQETALRVADPTRYASPVVVCNNEHRFIIAEQLREIDRAPSDILLEPVGRNTAPAAAVAAEVIARRDPAALMLLLPSDHIVADTAAFDAAVDKAAAAVAASPGLMTFGIRPTTPETGFGYIERGAAWGSAGAFRVASFREKPDQKTAAAWLEAGRHDWNSGMFLLPVGLFLDELARHAPEVLAQARAAVDAGHRDLDFFRLGADAFGASPSISIDYAVMERTDKAGVVPADLGWSDVGSWGALWEISEKDGQGNVFRGDVVAHGSRGTYARADGRQVVALVGVEDLVVVATDDVVLVAERGKAQDVKAIVEALEAQSREEPRSHRRVYRPWGWYETIDAGGRFQVKQICLKPGAKLSLQKHFHRAEHWVVVEGTGIVTRDDERILLQENQSTYIPLGAVHRLENPGKVPLVMIEVQSGTYLGEDDIVRFEDTYGRA